MVNTRSQIVLTQHERCIKTNCYDKLSCDGDTLCLSHKIIFLRSEFKAYKINAIVIRKKVNNKKYIHKYCSDRSCQNIPVSKGKCARHSGMFKCKENGCSKMKQIGGFCVTHGGTYIKASFCNENGCNRFNQGGGFCRTHGGGKICKFGNGCKSTIVSDIGFCKNHINNIPTQVLVSKYIAQN